MKNIPLLTLIVLLSGCMATPLKPEAGQVVMLITAKPSEQCFYLGEVIGSQGEWYDYWFTPNQDLAQGALNEMKNRTQEMGGNTVYLNQELAFHTSKTFLGQAFKCPLTPKQNGGVVF